MNEVTTIDHRTGITQPHLFGPGIDPSRVSAPSFTEALVDPAGVFRDPAEIVTHPRFTREEKRTILLSWARDELVLEQVANRAVPELRPKSRIDSVIAALAQVDALAASEYRAVLARIRGSSPGAVLWRQTPPAGGRTAHGGELCRNV